MEYVDDNPEANRSCRLLSRLATTRIGSSRIWLKSCQLLDWQEEVLVLLHGLNSLNQLIILCQWQINSCIGDVTEKVLDISHILNKVRQTVML